MSTELVAAYEIEMIKQDELSLKATTESLFFLDDSQWNAILNHLPVRQRGPRRINDRIVISGILHVLQSGCAWRDCPREYGPYMTVFNRYLRWTKRGIWQSILDELLNNQKLRKLSFPTRPMQVPMVGLGSESRPLRSAEVTDLNCLAVGKSDRLGPSDRLGQAFDSPEHTLAETELKYIFRTHEDRSREKWIQPIVQWHLRRAGLTRPACGSDLIAPRDVPSMPDNTARLNLLIALFNSDYVDTKTRLIAALECLNFYATGGTDGGTAAKKMLDVLLLSSNCSSKFNHDKCQSN